MDFILTSIYEIFTEFGFPLFSDQKFALLSVDTSIKTAFDSVFIYLVVILWEHPEF